MALLMKPLEDDFKGWLQSGDTYISIDKELDGGKEPTLFDVKFLTTATIIWG